LALFEACVAALRLVVVAGEADGIGRGACRRSDSDNARQGQKSGECDGVCFADHDGLLCLRYWMSSKLGASNSSIQLIIVVLIIEYIDELVMTIHPEFIALWDAETQPPIVI
jgi:hypothetical protein